VTGRPTDQSVQPVRCSVHMLWQSGSAARRNQTWYNRRSDRSNEAFTRYNRRPDRSVRRSYRVNAQLGASSIPFGPL